MTPIRASFFALAFFSAPAPAFADLYVSTFPSSIALGVGGSASLNISVQYLPTNIDAVLQTQYPTGQTFQIFYDSIAQGYAFFTAIGSQQGRGYANYFWDSNAGGLISDQMATFTYDKAGQYTIDYTYNASGVAYINGEIYDANFNVLASGLNIADVGESTSGSGKIYLTVGAVPEPSTWVMLLLGFAGLGFMGYRRSRKYSISLATA